MLSINNMKLKSGWMLLLINSCILFAQIPEYYNIRENIPNPPRIKSQHFLPSCQTFATVSLLEYLIKKEIKEKRCYTNPEYMVELSVAQAIGCANYFNPAFDLWTNGTKFVEESVNPMENKAWRNPPLLDNFECINNSVYAEYLPASDSWYGITLTDQYQKIKEYLCKNIPVVIYLRIPSSTTEFSSLDYVDYTDPTLYLPGLHICLIIGYDDNYNGGVWLIQNSWGPYVHGGDGIVRLKYGSRHGGCFTNPTFRISPEFKRKMGYTHPIVETILAPLLLN